MSVRQILLDSEDGELLFELALDELDEMLESLDSDSDTYICRGQSVGWQNNSGEIEITISSGRDLVSKLCPNGSWSLTATLLSDEELKLRLSHHDNPGGETHVLTAK